MLESLSLEVWHLWLLAACVIAAVELILVGSYYLLALAVGAAVVTAVAAMMELSLTAQWLVFAVATAIAALLMRFLRTPAQNKEPDDISHMMGKTVTVVETISPRGRVDYKSVTWAAESDDVLEAGDTACITRVHGSTLYVTSRKENI
ncbi:MAG: NfeD family protein [Ghiorsea sp.]|nr:NfeD family protein [Ghiorsea sp.]